MILKYCDHIGKSVACFVSGPFELSQTVHTGQSNTIEAILKYGGLLKKILAYLSQVWLKFSDKTTIFFSYFVRCFMSKTSQDRKWLPQKHLIGCQGFKLFLTKDFYQKLFF